MIPITVIKNSKAKKLSIEPKDSEFNQIFDVSKYDSAASLLQDIVDYIESKGGACT